MLTDEQIKEFCDKAKLPPLPESLNGLPGEYREAVKTLMTEYGKTCALRMYGNMLSAAPAAQPERWRPEACPITGLPFFMWIEHHETGQLVPTYGGPYDSYTIPVKQQDGSYCRERYDHDNGWWVTDEIDDVGVQIVSDQLYVSEHDPAAAPAVHAT